MKAFTAPKPIIAVVLCYSAIVTFSPFLGEAVYAHSASNNNHEHGRIVSVSEFMPQVTPLQEGWQQASPSCSGKGK